MNRSTGIGSLWRRDPEAAKEELRIALEANRGVLRHTASYLGITHRHLSRLLARANLMDDVEEMKRRAQQVPEDIARARAALAE